MTNVEKYVRSHETGKLVRVDQVQAEDMWVRDDKAAVLDKLFRIILKVTDGGPLKIDESGIDEQYLPIVDSILYAEARRREEHRRREICDILGCCDRWN